MKNNSLLLACDLDRTVIPDGPDPISNNAIDEFNNFIILNKIFLSYVSGRNLREILSVISEYNVSEPEAIIANDGTSIYLSKNGNWQLLSEWEKSLEPEWNGKSGSEIHSLLSDITSLKLQEPEHQDKFKLSYYAPEDIDNSDVKSILESKLLKYGIHVNVVTSIDQIGHFAYLDILPKSGTKIDALKFLIKLYKFDSDNVVVCGDSGNDLTLLTGGYKAIVVNNATDEFKQQVSKLANNKGYSAKVYIAKGGYENMNGNYVGGILEGLDYFKFQAIY